jgi:hypothetical protein
MSALAGTDTKLASSNGLRLLRSRRGFRMCQRPTPTRYACCVFEAGLERLYVDGEPVAVISGPSAF